MSKWFVQVVHVCATCFVLLVTSAIQHYSVRWAQPMLKPWFHYVEVNLCHPKFRYMNKLHTLGKRAFHLSKMKMSAGTELFGLRTGLFDKNKIHRCLLLVQYKAECGDLSPSSLLLYIQAFYSGDRPGKFQQKLLELSVHEEHNSQYTQPHIHCILTRYRRSLT